MGSHFPPKPFDSYISLLLLNTDNIQIVIRYILVNAEAFPEDEGVCGEGVGVNNVCLFGYFTY